MTPASLELQVGLQGGADAATLEVAEELREVLLPDVEIDAVDEGHGGLGVPQDERGREDVRISFFRQGSQPPSQKPGTSSDLKRLPGRGGLSNPCASRSHSSAGMRLRNSPHVFESNASWRFAT